MTPYANRGGDSSITAYDYGSDYILVEFKGANVYHYSLNDIGREHLNNMISRAKDGEGLGEYINRNRDVHAAGKKQ